MIKIGTYKEGCPIKLDRLRLINVSYYDFDSIPQHNGEIVVIDAVADKVVNIFEELYKRNFPIAKIKRIERYNGSDDGSMTDNNTSGFNCRLITNGLAFSIHGYGLAIDINPIQNPYLKMIKGEKEILLPKEGGEYLNREDIRPGMAEPIVNIFVKNGFRDWGGNWDNPLDWQHFQPPKFVAMLIAAMSPADAKEFFTLYADNILHKLFDTFLDDDKDLILFYENQPEKFMEILQTSFAKLNEYTPTEATDFFRAELDAKKIEL